MADSGPHPETESSDRLLFTGTRFETDSSPTTFDAKNRTVQKGEMFLAWSEDQGHT